MMFMQAVRFERPEATCKAFFDALDWILSAWNFSNLKFVPGTNYNGEYRNPRIPYSTLFLKRPIRVFQSPQESMHSSTVYSVHRHST